MKIIPENCKKQGDLGEAKAEKFCLENGYPYKPALSGSLLQKDGVDFIYTKGKDIIFVDVKNSLDLNIGNSLLENNVKKFYLRHPLRKNTIAEEIWINNQYKNIWEFQGSITQYFLTYFFSNEYNLNLFKEYLFKKNGERIIGNPDFYFNNLKKDLMAFVTDKVYINWDRGQEQITLRMITKVNAQLIADKKGNYGAYNKK